MYDIEYDPYFWASKEAIAFYQQIFEMSFQPHISFLRQYYITPCAQHLKVVCNEKQGG